MSFSLSFFCAPSPFSRFLTCCSSAVFLTSACSVNVGDGGVESLDGISKERPNIVFIVSDDHSARHYGYLDPDNFDTPNLTRLATEGTVFTRAYVSVPQCAPSRASLMTGRSALDIRSTRFSAPLARGLETFPEVLRENGYFTGVIGRSHHLDGSLSQGENADAMFEEFDLRATSDRFDVVHVGKPGTTQQEWIDVELKNFLDAKPDEAPFLIQYNFVDPHRPWNASEFEPNPADVVLPVDMPDRQSVREDFAKYVGEIEHMDSQIGDIIDLLEENNALENTLIVFMGDNGASLLRGKGTLLENGINVPLIAWMPDKVPAGQLIDGLISGEDIAPTFIDIAGVDKVEAMTGVSFADVLKGESTETNRDFVYATRGTHGVGLPTTTVLFDINRAIVSSDVKLIYNVLWQLPYNPADADGSPMWLDLKQANESGELDPLSEDLLFSEPRPMFELYDLAKDPFEMKNQIGNPEYAEVKENLRARLERWMIKNKDYVPLPYLPDWQVEYDKGVETRTLGYQAVE